MVSNEGAGAKFTPGRFGQTMKITTPMAKSILCHGSSCVASSADIVTGRGARVNPADKMQQGER